MRDIRDKKMKDVRDKNEGCQNKDGREIEKGWINVELRTFFWKCAITLLTWTLIYGANW